MVFPLPVLLQLADVVLSTALDQLLTERVAYSIEEPVFHGVVRYSQPLDLTFAMAQTIEKGIDSKSMGSVAQCDIRCYYDEVSVTSIAASLDDDTIPSSLLRSLVMLQMLPIVQVHCGAVSFQLRHRTVGALTGSRSAGQLARVPVADVFRRLRGRVTGTIIPSVGLMSWIDNIIALADSPTSAVYLIEQVEDLLKSRWNLHIKESSKELLVAKGCPVQFALQDGWSQTDELASLGDIISNDMSPHPLLKQAEVKSWAAFWRNSGSSLARHLTVTQRVKQNQKMVWPCSAHCISRVPPSKSNLTRIQQHQNKMTKIMLQEWPRSDETPETFVKRVNASISYLNRSVSWSKLVVKNATSWRDHLLRPNNFSSPSSKLLRHNDADFVQTCRMLLYPNNTQRHGCGLRCIPGNLHSRWEEAVRRA
jgi:hypothetical protein